MTPASDSSAGPGRAGAPIGADPAMPSGDAGATPRFRRAERPAPAAGDPRPLDGAGGGIDPADAFQVGDALAPFATGTARGMEPLAALAAAFHANAMALQKSQEMQNDLGKALQRADRSEALLQSTGALNETFRGLTQVQRSLAGRIDANERESASGRWFGPVVMLAALSVVGVGLYLILQYVNRWRDDTVGTGDIATQLTAQYEKGIEQGKKSAEEVAVARQRASDERVKRLEDDIKALDADREAARAAAKDAQTSLQALQSEVSTTRVDVLKARAIEEEAVRLRAEAALRDPELDRMRRDLAEERTANASLRQKLADVGLGRTPSPDALAPAARPDPAAIAAAAAAPDPTVTRDRRELDRAKDRLNALFQAGAGTRPDYLQVMRMGGVGAQRMTDVVFARYAPGGRLMSSIHAKDARILLDRVRRTVEIVFADGGLDYGGNTVPFPGGTFSVVVAEGDAVSAWRESGLTLVTSK